MQKANHPAPAKSKPLVFGLIALIVLVAVLMTFAGSRAGDLISASVDQLRAFKATVDAHGAIATSLYVAVYIALVAVSVPGAIWLSIFAGFLFGFWTGYGVAMIGGCAGATFAYLLGRYVFARWTRIRAAKRHGLIEKGFTQHVFNYLLVLRLMPGLPFVVVNLAVAAFKVPLSRYIGATLIGMVPSTAAHVAIGVGAAELVAKRGTVSTSDLVVNPTIALVLVVFALMAATPIAYRYFAKKRKA